MKDLFSCCGTSSSLCYHFYLGPEDETNDENFGPAV